MTCPHCGASDLVKSGTTASGKQRWKCKACNRTTITPNGTPSREPKQCRICGKPVLALGLCSAHYEQTRRDDRVDRATCTHENGWRKFGKRNGRQVWQCKWCGSVKVEKRADEKSS